MTQKEAFIPIEVCRAVSEFCMAPVLRVFVPFVVQGLVSDQAAAAASFAGGPQRR